MSKTKEETALTPAGAQKPATKEGGLKALLASPSIRQRFEEMLGKRAPSFMSSIISAVSANAQLSQADPLSVISAAAVAAAMDLPINSSLGFAHIVPYKGVAQFQMGWKGFVQLAMRSGQYKTINITPILEGQIVSHNRFTGEMEFTEEAKSDKQIGYLLYFKLLNGYEKYYYLTHEQVLEHGKEYSASFKKGYGMWVDNFEAMALKTVAKLGLSKYGILSVDMQKAIELDQAALDENGQPNYIDAEARDVSHPEPSRTEKLNQEAAPPVHAAKDARDPDPDSFANSTGGTVFGKPAVPVEAVESLRIDIVNIMERLQYSDAMLDEHAMKMFKKAPLELSVAELKQLKSKYQEDLARSQVK